MLRRTFPDVQVFINVTLNVRSMVPCATVSSLIVTNRIANSRSLKLDDTALTKKDATFSFNPTLLFVLGFYFKQFKCYTIQIIECSFQNVIQFKRYTLELYVPWIFF